MTSSPPRASLWLFLLANYAVLVVVSTGFVPGDALRAPASAAWIAAVLLSYPLLYLLPAFALAWLARRASAPLAAWSPRTAAGLAWIPAALLFAAVQLLILADLRIHQLYGFHLNGFVWNLVTTPGGIAAMGAGSSAYLALAGLALAVLAAELGLAALVARPWASIGPLRSLRSSRGVAALCLGLLALSLGERGAFGASRVAGYVPILQLEEAFPFYLRTSFNSAAKRLGFDVARSGGIDADLGKAQLRYPLRPLEFRQGAPRYNVVVLCAESLRADALTPERMPATWAFAERATRFTQHLSGGNGTRMGVFGLFYGLPGPYWFKLMAQKRGPAMLRALLDRGWQVEGWTSDDFSYPEFDQTVFADVERAHLHEGGPGKSWQRDRAMVGGIVEFLDRRDAARPFFLYAFFESPHARYDFPPETAVHRPYLEDFNYVTMDLERDIGLIQNRYWNSVRHLDTQYERVLHALEARGLLDSSIVVVTGDHGEEFMEDGHWGHNSTFSEPQIRVPLVVSVPGRPAAVVDRLTSHLDLPATLLTELGATSPPGDYSLGHSLFSGAARSYALVSDWSRIAYVDTAGKLPFPVRASAFLRQDGADRRDEPLPDSDGFLRARTQALALLMTDLGRFTARR